MKARAIARTIQLGSISSLRCQKTRILLSIQTSRMRSDVSRTTVQDLGDQAIWWSQTGSNRRPHACKARALPAELWPRNQKTNAHRLMKVVGLGRLELPTSRLSSARSNQLSYKPLTPNFFEGSRLHACITMQHRRSPWRVFVREERETKTAKSRQWSSLSFDLEVWRPMAPECF